MTKQKKTSQKKRTYDNSLRSVQSSEKQLAIIECLVNLLAQKRGGEVKIHEIAQKTGMTERTIFRFFKDKKSLHEAMDQYLMSYISAGARHLDEFDFVGFGVNAMKLFEENEAVTLAYVLSPLGKDARDLFRNKLNGLMVDKIAAEKKIEITDKNRSKVALVVNLVNAKMWYDLKTEHQLSGDEVKEAMGWALTTLLKAL